MLHANINRKMWRLRVANKVSVTNQLPDVITQLFSYSISRYLHIGRYNIISVPKVCIGLTFQIRRTWPLFVFLIEYQNFPWAYFFLANIGIFFLILCGGVWRLFYFVCLVKGSVELVWTCCGPAADKGLTDTSVVCIWKSPRLGPHAQ